ncbi:MAG: undecaprenyl-phosphate glucose phosphotransferase [Bdellovibrionales bacterium GWB1_55_8]|nr:MAG: undecaprenyl-phosphate glucose phosphotransferase [Bdellovibrionales bacterium GWB1_55_8]
MLKRYHHIVGGVFRVVDASVIGLVWLASYFIRFHLGIFEVSKGLPKFESYAALTPLVMILWSTVFASMNVYQSRRMLRRTHEAHQLLRAHGVALLFFIALTYLITEYRYSRIVMINFAVLGGFFLVAFRLSLRNALRAIRRNGHNLRHVLVVGEGKAVETLVARLEKFPELGFRVLGAVTHEKSTAMTVAGKPVMGHFGEIRKVLQETRADRLVISLPRQQYGDLDRVLEELKDETIDVQLIPDIHEYVTLGCEVEDFDGLPIVNLNDSPLDGWGAYAKRATDILVALIALALLSPVLIVIGVLVKMTSKGPILFGQERMGLDGRTFQMLKFRSMRMDAEASGAVWATPGDARRTPIGAFLRSTSLDELPQFWNVLTGDMSLVGPRPERPVFVREFRKDIAHYMLRHKVKAGITGWAQVNGWRGNTSLDRRIECDLYYIRNWSYLLDWKILVMTLWKGFINRNAY